MTRRLFLAGLTAPAVAAWACATKAGPAVAPDRIAPDRGVQRGLASYYGFGDGFHGRRTASGERFDMNRLTAAHLDLPFGTRVEVRNLKNGRRVELTINDRFSMDAARKGRILDVSYGAARRLGMVADGVVPIELTVRARPRRG